jgi:nitrilase
MKVAAIQMVSATTVQANLDRAGHWLRQAALQGAELAVLPEYFCLLGHKDVDKLAVQEPPGSGPIQQFLAQQAEQLGLWIVGGTLPLSSTTAPDRVCNSSCVYGPTGQRMARYDKIHLFRFDNGQERYDESRTLLPGQSPVVWDLPSKDGKVWRMGMSICYDLRFPELYRQLAQAGADVMLVPSAFTHTTGQAHWEVLLRARAIENLCYVVAAAQGGQHENGRRTWGHSMVVDPWGQVQGEWVQGEGVVVCELDGATIKACRDKLPALQHRVL